MQTVVKKPDTRTPYTQRFFELITEQSRRSADVIVPIVLGLLNEGRDPVHGVVDIGCGAGVWLASFLEHGVEEIRGLDGDYIDPSQLQIEPACFSACNLEVQRPDELGTGRFDLAVCLEVAEHLTDARGLALVDALTNLAPAILFSAAIPHQAGTRHINCQWQSYWAQRFVDRGYVPLDVVRPLVWDEPKVGWWFAQNSILYVSHETLGEYPGLAEAEPVHVSWQLRDLDRTHPRFLDELEERSRTSLYRLLTALRGALAVTTRHCVNVLGRPH